MGLRLFNDCGWVKASKKRVLGSICLVFLAVAVGSCQSLTVLHSFQAGKDGSYPYGGASVDSRGNVYGVTGGTIYEIDAAGEYSVLHTFIYPEGVSPMDTPLLGRDGRLYGTTYQGGIVSGTVWAFSATNNLGVLHSFSSYPGDGEHPYAGVVQDALGNLYGATPYGGGSGFGDVYKIDRTKNETIIYSFGAVPDGQDPFGGVLLGRNGVIFGTTQLGGAFGYGTVFKISASGHETTLHSFDKVDGYYPTGNFAGDELVVCDGNSVPFKSAPVDND